MGRGILSVNFDDMCHENVKLKQMLSAKRTRASSGLPLCDNQLGWLWHRHGSEYLHNQLSFRLVVFGLYATQMQDIVLMQVVGSDTGSTPLDKLFVPH